MLLTLLLACAHAPPTYASMGELPLATLRGRSVAIAPTVLVADTPAPAVTTSPRDPVDAATDLQHLPEPTLLTEELHGDFLRNELVGTVKLGGGIVHTGGMTRQARARTIVVDAPEALKAQARAWLDGATANVLTNAGLPTMAWPATTPPCATNGSPEGTLAFSRQPTRGLHPDDGSDDINAPRTALTALPLGRCTQEVTPPDVLVVPVVRTYLTHNGGWFVGQAWGVPGGARVEAHLVFYDGRSGAVLRDDSALGRVLLEGRSQPSSAELDAALLQAEMRVVKGLSRALR